MEALVYYFSIAAFLLGLALLVYTIVKPHIHRWMFLMGYACVWVIIARISGMVIDAQPHDGLFPILPGFEWFISLCMAFVLMVIYGIAGFVVMLIHGIRARKAPPKTE